MGNIFFLDQSRKYRNLLFFNFLIKAQAFEILRVCAASNTSAGFRKMSHCLYHMSELNLQIVLSDCFPGFLDENTEVLISFF